MTNKVYCIYNINNESETLYVGSTPRQMGARMAEHRYESKRSVRRGHSADGTPKTWNNRCIFSKYLKSVMDLQDIKYRILEECGDISKKELRIIEQKYIDEINPIYNTQSSYCENSYSKWYNKNMHILTEPIECDCGSIVQRKNMNRHLKSRLHQNYLNSIK